jgi:hypothetical protein
MAIERASLGSFSLVSPVLSNRTRAASLGGTSSTRSPAATNRWPSQRCARSRPTTTRPPAFHAAAVEGDCDQVAVRPSHIPTRVDLLAITIGVAVVGVAAFVMAAVTPS